MRILTHKPELKAVQTVCETDLNLMVTLLKQTDESINVFEEQLNTSKAEIEMFSARKSKSPSKLFQGNMENESLAIFAQ